MIATGSSPNRPADVPFDAESVFDSNTILKLPRMPKTMTVLGAGVIGIEYASIFAALGVYVTLVDTRDRLLPYLDREIVSILERELGELHVEILHDDRYVRVEPVPGASPRVTIETRQGRRITSDVLLYCVGRDGNTKDLGLETIGLAPDKYGLLTVNEELQTTHPHIYAVGDVIGYPALASTSMEQGRRAMRHAFGLARASASTENIPFAIYSIPEVSYVGETEEKLKEKGSTTSSAGATTDEPPRPDHRRHPGAPEARLRRGDRPPHRRPHRRPLGERARPHRAGLPEDAGDGPRDRRVALQLPDALGHVPPRRPHGRLRAGEGHASDAG
ncbi:MAG: FAD-dependent oxidoreductase [Holophagales bacterium]|nr:FAD-dependent oxidoreductase [Holophagales bacterium]